MKDNVGPTEKLMKKNIFCGENLVGDCVRVLKKASFVLGKFAGVTSDLRYISYKNKTFFCVEGILRGLRHSIKRF